MNLSFLYNLNLKKIIFVILFLILCFGLGFGIYWMFFKPEKPRPGEPGYLPPGAVLPNVNEGFNANIVRPGGELPLAGNINQEERIVQPDPVAQGGSTLALPLHEDKVTNVTLSTDGQGVSFYNKEDNKFYTLSEDGQDMIPLSDQEFYNVQDVYWSDDKTKAIITYPDESKILYDFSKRKQITLNKEINDPDFSRQDKVAYKYISAESENNWLAVADIDGSQVKLIEPLGDQGDFVQVSWSPTNEVVALYSKPIGLDKSEVFFIGLHDENFRSLVVDGSHFKGLWSPSGAKLLYHVVSGGNNYNPSLWIADAHGDNIGRHKFNLGLSTWVDKCVFSNETTLYCAVPRELPEGAGLYPEIIKQTKDLIYKINLSTGLKELIADPVFDGENNFSISSMFLSKDKKFLFFWDSITEKVYRIQLR
ncbi:MAG: hypothetical protein DRJ06_06420 [Candidatus Aminicenantes bacterium]|nr:MAG: hypothetical protein DRJ06_06420 [Candidatus Aminicenantes bacterium]